MKCASNPQDRPDVYCQLEQGHKGAHVSTLEGQYVIVWV